MTERENMIFDATVQITLQIIEKGRFKDHAKAYGELHTIPEILKETFDALSELLPDQE